LSKLSSSLEDGELTIKILSGAFNESIEESFINAYKLLGFVPDQLTIDFLNVKFMGGAGVGILLELSAHAKESKIDVRVINCSGHVEKVLKITRLDELIKIS
jgi:anti-anti-sigma factor